VTVRHTRSRTSGDASPFILLWRAFVLQFFTNESATSDVYLRERAVWVLTFLVVPGVFILVLLLPEISFVMIRAKFGRGPASSVDDLLEWVAFVLTTYAMAGTGFITVLAWDALTFDRRDAMVLGPLPLRRPTMIGAKLAALGTLLAAGSIPINVVNSAVFASETADQLGGAVLVKHFAATLVATVGASLFIFAAIVMIRSTAALLGGPRLTAVLGPPLQFFFIVALLCLVILCPAVSSTRFVTNTRTNWMPSAWFMGLFEQLRGSPRTFNMDVPVLTLARRAWFATPIAIAGAVILSVLEFRRHTSLASAPSASAGLLGGARLTRTLARVLVGRNAVARTVADFILLTLARNPARQVPIAINAAIGAAIVIAALSRDARDLASFMHPRTVVLWIPLVLGYWTAIGVRASFLVPSELPASWVFRVNAPNAARAYRSAVRASMLVLVVPPTLLITVVLMIPLLGWGVALWHALFACAVATLLVEVLVLTMCHIPFTRPYQAGHAKLNTRWWMYLVGLWAFAYWPTRVELLRLGDPVALLEGVGAIATAIVVLEAVERQRALNRSVEAIEEAEDDRSEFTVLGLAGWVEHAQTGP
jgi:hypothetical protein